MQGLIKHVLWAAPVAALVIILAWVTMRETTEDMRRDEAQFDRDWYETKAEFARNPEDRERYMQRAAVAHRQLSSARVAAEQQRQRVKQTDGAIDGALKDYEKGKR